MAMPSFAEMLLNYKLMVPLNRHLLYTTVVRTGYQPWSTNYIDFQNIFPVGTN